MHFKSLWLVVLPREINSILFYSTSFFYIYVMATSFFYIYIDIYIGIYIDIYKLNAIFMFHKLPIVFLTVIDAISQSFCSLNFSFLLCQNVKTPIVQLSLRNVFSSDCQRLRRAMGSDVGVTASRANVCKSFCRTTGFQVLAHCKALQDIIISVGYQKILVEC